MCIKCIKESLCDIFQIHSECSVLIAITVHAGLPRLLYFTIYDVCVCLGGSVTYSCMA